MVEAMSRAVMALLWCSVVRGLVSPRPAVFGRSRSGSQAQSSSFDVVVVGGGMSGLAAALELRRRGRSVCVLSRDLAQGATLAAGGMLAPQAERLPPGPLLDLCVRSRDTWPGWLATLDEPPPLNAVGGFVSPCLTEGDPVGSWVPVESAGPAEWLDGDALRAMEPSVGEGALGGWWYPLETWVDPVRAHAALVRTCEREGVLIRVGVDVAGLDLSASECDGVRLRGGDVVRGTEVCVAAGAWLRTLLPIPVDAQKGQMVALKAPTEAIALGGPDRVVYGSDCYVIPRGDRVVVGATVENGTYTTHTDVRGLCEVLTKATALCPGLADFEVDESWSGLRPTTTDGAPVLGRTRWTNLWVAGGYWRNGILLAPTAAKLLADAMDDVLAASDAALLDACRWDRFFAPRRPTSARFLANHRVGAPGKPDPPGVSASPADLDRAGYDSIRAKPAADGDDARSKNRAALFGDRGADADAEATTKKAPAATGLGGAIATLLGGRRAPPPQNGASGLGEGGYEAISNQKTAAMDEARTANRDRLFGGGPFPGAGAATAAPVADRAAGDLASNGFPYASPDEDVQDLVLSLRQVRPDGTLGEDISRRGATLPGDLSGPRTKADGITSLQPVPKSSRALPPDAAADALYATIAKNKEGDPRS